MARTIGPVPGWESIFQTPMASFWMSRSKHESAPPNRLVLKAKARPLGTAKVIMEIQPEGSGSRVTMVEDPGDRLTKFVDAMLQFELSVL